jgi:menaquinone-dependent protoporphyrinogen oxidase
MVDPILVAYASKYGSTQEVAESIAATLRTQMLHADVRPAADVEGLGEYGGVVLGGGIYMGRWHRDARRFVKRFEHELAALPVALFALGPTDREPEHVASAEKQFRSALDKLPVEPFETHLFGGAIDPQKLRFPFNHMPAADVRDWDEVRAWAGKLAVRFEPGGYVCGPTPATVPSALSTLTS